MPNKPVLLFVVLALSSLTFAQRNQPQSTVRGVQPADTTCLFNFSSGTGPSLTTYCVTQNGNIAEFSGAGTEFISSPGPATEGFGMCDNTVLGSPIDYFDYASSDSGNWNPSTATLTGTTVVVNRTTTDGNWQLTQTIVDMKASPLAYGSARVTMALKNLSPIERFLVGFRYAQVLPAPFPFADFDTTPTTALVMTPSASGPGLSSTGSFIRNPADSAVARVVQTTTPPDPCGINNFSTSFFEGTGGILQLYILDIKSHATVTFSATYKPI